MLEYKVLTERDKRFSGGFDAEALERVLNECAADGWRLADGFVASSVWKSSKAEIVLVLERPAIKPKPERVHFRVGRASHRREGESFQRGSLLVVGSARGRRVVAGLGESFEEPGAGITRPARAPFSLAMRHPWRAEYTSGSAFNRP